MNDALQQNALVLERNPFGKLILTNAQGERFTGVLPVRAFPILAPDEGISLLSTEGHEVAWVERLSDLPVSYQSLIEDELAHREFMPVLVRIVDVSSFSTPCTWTVETDRGRIAFVLRSDEDIRRIGNGRSLLVADAHGIHYLVPDQKALDSHSKRLLDRFL